MVPEDELDALFRLPLTDFVAGRDALAARLRKAGEREAAAAVKALKKPTPTAWALNQLHVEDAALLHRAHERAGEVRGLHARDGVTAELLRQALDAQRAAVQAVADAVQARCAAAGLPQGPVPQRKALTTVRALLAGLGEEPPGRMTCDLEPAGFEALGGLAALGTPALRDVKAAPAVEPARDEARLADRQREAERARLHSELARLSADTRKAAERTAERARRAQRVEREHAAVETRARELAEELARLRERQDALAAELVEARSELAREQESEAAARAAEAALRAQLDG